jgi:hypothetical protein
VWCSVGGRSIEYKGLTIPFCHLILQFEMAAQGDLLQMEIKLRPGIEICPPIDEKVETKQKI